MRELVNVFLGQAGVQQSHAAWELLVAEYGISMDGKLSTDETLNEGIDRLFSRTKDESVVPLTLLIDTEKTVIDEIRNGPYKKLFNEKSFVTSVEDTSSIFPRGYFGDGRIIMKSILKNLQSIIERCDSLAGITFWHSVGGGTGSGLFSLMVEELEAWSRLDKMELMTYPSQHRSQGILEPYNSILTQHYTMDSMDVSFMFDNEGLYRIAEDRLNIKSASYPNINRIIAQMYSSITAPSRFPGALTNFKELTHNLVPYPRIHFPICSLSNLSNVDALRYYNDSVENVTINGLFYDSNLISCKPSEGYYMACCFIYRGNVSPSEAYKTVQQIKTYQKLKFVDWCPTGIKTIFCRRAACVIQRGNVGLSAVSLGILSNNSSITDIILMNTYKFQLLFRKRAFVHWFIGDGLEEREFNDGLENVVCLISDYESLSDENADEEDQFNKKLLTEDKHMELFNSNVNNPYVPNEDLCTTKTEISTLKNTVSALTELHKTSNMPKTFFVNDDYKCLNPLHYYTFGKPPISCAT